MKVQSSRGTDARKMIAEGVRGVSDVDALAVRGDREVSVLAWNYHDDDLPTAAEQVRLDVTGLPGRVLMKHYRIDDTHSNAWTVWKKMGSPQNPTAEQYAALEAAGQLELLESPRWVTAGKAILFELPRQGVSLVQLSW